MMVAWPCRAGGIGREYIAALESSTLVRGALGAACQWVDAIDRYLRRAGCV